MPRMRDILQRFRPISSPGAASAGGVPADRRADLAAELRPLMNALDETRRQCGALIEEAERAGDRTRTEALDEAARIRASAAARAAAEGSHAADRLSRRSNAGAEESALAARARADAVTERARALIPGYVQLVVDSTGLR